MGANGDLTPKQCDENYIEVPARNPDGSCDKKVQYEFDNNSTSIEVEPSTLEKIGETIGDFITKPFEAEYRINQEKEKQIETD